MSDGNTMNKEIKSKYKKHEVLRTHIESIMPVKTGVCWGRGDNHHCFKRKTLKKLLGL